MIKTLKDLRFYMMADAIMNEQVFPQGIYKYIDYKRNLIHRFFKTLRLTEYLCNCKYHKLLSPIKYLMLRHYYRLCAKTGFDIPLNSLGYGCRIGHLSTIVMNNSTKIGNYCCIHNNIVFGDANPKVIGDHCYIGSNVTFAKAVTLAEGCMVSSNSFVRYSCLKPNTLLGGAISKPIKQHARWTDEPVYHDEYLRCEQLRKQMYKI